MFKIPPTRKGPGIAPTMTPELPSGNAGPFHSLPPVIAPTPGARSLAGVRSRIALAAVAALMGSLLIFGAGFANSQVLHEAAHDARHGLGFPCH